MPTKNTNEVVHPHIEKKADTCGGEPIIKNTRISVRVIVRWYNMKKSVDEIVAMYPHINHAMVYDALSYYYDHREEMDQILEQNLVETIQAKYQGQPWLK